MRHLISFFKPKHSLKKEIWHYVQTEYRPAEREAAFEALMREALK